MGDSNRSLVSQTAIIAEEKPENVGNNLNYDLEGQGVSKINSEADKLAEAMVAAVLEGFRAHDKGSLDEAKYWFAAVDANMFGEEIDSVKTGEAYANALDAKDCLEYKVLMETDPETAVSLADGNIDISEYKRMTAEELMKLKQDKKNSLGVRDVDTRNLGLEGVERLSEDREARNLMINYFQEKEDALSFELRGAYAINETDFWLDHKTDENYLIACGFGRMAALAAANKNQELRDNALARITDKDIQEHGVKPSDGLYSVTPSALPYLTGVEGHDLHNKTVMNSLISQVAPYYKASLTNRVIDDPSFMDIEEFAASYYLSGDELDNYLSELQAEIPVEI